MKPADVLRIRADFPQLGRELDGRPPVYLDNACTTLRPEPVIRAVAEHQRRTPSCHGRASHRFGREATEAYREARAVVARFIGAPRPEEVLFVRNATEGINLVARCFPLEAGDAVLTTGQEHNSNLLPWQRLAASGRGVRHEILRIDARQGFDLEALPARLARGVKLVSLFHVSNLTGLELPLREVCDAAHAHGARVLVDAAQSVMTRPVDVRASGADLLVFSLHKMMGPTGVGVLWGRTGVLEAMAPFLVGGDTVRDVFYDRCALADLPERFEAGVANVDGAVGARAAIEYLESIGVERIHDHVVRLNRLATEGLQAFRDRVRLLGPEEPERRGGILNFYAEGLDSRSVARVLDARAGIMVRYGRHCVHAWYNAEGVPASVRVSFAAYNTEDEVALLLRTLGEVLSMAG